MQTLAYVYKWTHIPTYAWYVGVRYGKGCNPDDGYICSSKSVKPRILANPEEWRREILATGSVEEMRQLEREILELFFDKDDRRCLNRNGTFAPPVFTGGDHPMYGKEVKDETRRKMSVSAKRRWTCDAYKKSQILAFKQAALAKAGQPRKPRSDQTKRKLSLVSLGNPDVLSRCRRNAARQRGKPNLPLCKPVVGTELGSEKVSLRFVSAGEAARNGFSQCKISLCCLGSRKSHKGYVWRYATQQEILEYFPEIAKLRTG